MTDKPDDPVDDDEFVIDWILFLEMMEQAFPSKE